MSLKVFKKEFKIEEAFGNLYRAETVLIIVKNSRGQFLLGSKPNFFPPTITRLLGGGVHEGETPLQAAQRELEEELGVKIEINNLSDIAKIEISAVDNASKIFLTSIYLVNVISPIDKYKPGDDVKFIDNLSTKEMVELIRNYRNLSPSLWYKGEEGEFCWKDYGTIYGYIHEIALSLSH